jgi:hypothetical protein
LLRPSTTRTSLIPTPKKGRRKPIAGRPVARRLDDGKTLEVLRVCTDGTPNANSFLYGRIKRIALLLGYEKARPERNDSGMVDSSQYAPANGPQMAPVVSASPPRLTARKTAPSKVPAPWHAHEGASRLLATQPDPWITGGCWRRKRP